MHGVVDVSRSFLQAGSRRVEPSRHGAASESASGPLGGRRTLGLAGIVGCSSNALLGRPANCEAEEAAPATRRGRVVDEFNVLSPEARSSLDGILGKLEKDTGTRVRVLCPPPGIMAKKESFMKFFIPIRKDWQLDQQSAVIVAEERVAEKAQQETELPGQLKGVAQSMAPKKKEKEGFLVPATVASRNVAAQDKRPTILTIMSGNKFLDRYSVAVDPDFLYSVETTYGNKQYLEARGRDGAVIDAVNNVAAVLYNALDVQRAVRAGRATKPDRVSKAISVEEAAAILAKHP